MQNSDKILDFTVSNTTLSMSDLFNTNSLLNIYDDLNKSIIKSIRDSVIISDSVKNSISKVILFDATVDNGIIDDVIDNCVDINIHNNIDDDIVDVVNTNNYYKNYNDYKNADEQNKKYYKNENKSNSNKNTYDINKNKNNKNKNTFLRAKINSNLLKLEINSSDVNTSLREIRKIVEALSVQEDDVNEDLFTFELRSMLSEEFINNNFAVSEFKKYLSMEENYKIIKESITAIEEVDLINQKKFLIVSSNKIDSVVEKIISQIDIESTKHIIVHIKGLISETERLMIVDRVHQRFNNAKIRAFYSKQDIEGKVIIETVFFGDYVDGE